MNITSKITAAFVCSLLSLGLAIAEEPASTALPKAYIDGTGDGWRSLGEEDFQNVNCFDDTWTFKNGEIQCTGQPVGVMRSKKQFTNFELVFEWKHLKSAGNSGCFVWTIPEEVDKLTKPGLPAGGIEVQVLDHGYKEAYKKSTGKEGDWFSTNGDIFPVGKSKLTPFPPLSPNGARSFPSKELSKGVGEWNHYYVRAINGEIRLWVNGEEVSGGNNAVPATGYLCLESEGSPIEFRNLRIRELP